MIILSPYNFIISSNDFAIDLNDNITDIFRVNPENRMDKNQFDTQFCNFARKSLVILLSQLSSPQF